MTIRDFQARIHATYYGRDSARGALAAYAWLNEEIGELARAIRDGDAEAVATEMSDVMAWLATLANMLGIELETACQRFADGCPKCHDSPCRCAST